MTETPGTEAGPRLLTFEEETEVRELAADGVPVQPGLVLRLFAALDAVRGNALATLAALADMTGAYHAERKHEGRWSVCQHPRCQNARLATEGRGPFAAPFRDSNHARDETETDHE